MKSAKTLGAALLLAVLVSAAPAQAQDAVVPAGCVTSLPETAMPLNTPTQVWIGDQAAVRWFWLDLPAGWYDVIVDADESVVPVVIVDGQDIWEEHPFRVGLAEPGRVTVRVGAQQHYADQEFTCYGYSVTVRRVVPVDRRRP
jgi:hypothetical protein